MTHLKGAENTAENEKRLSDYKVYVLSSKEKSIVISAYIVIALIVSELFYRSVIPVVLFAGFVPLILKVAAKVQCERRKTKLKMQFSDGMSAYAAAIRAGYSPENAIGEARSEIMRMYGEEAILQKEFLIIKRKLSYGINIEVALKDLAARSGIKEIEEMADVFAIAKRSGGNLPEILRNTIYSLKEKKRLTEEIDTLMTAKRLEHRIMCLMPSGILLYVNLTSAEFVASLYEGFFGRLLMTVAIAVNVVAVVIGERIMKVKM